MDAPQVPGQMKYLPPELLGQIFICTKANYPPINTFVLACVCRVWRSVALSDSRLWDTLSVSLPTSFQEARSKAQMVSTYFERSAHHPLTISLLEPDYYGGLVERYTSHVVAALSPFLDRWRGGKVAWTHQMAIAFDLGSKTYPILQDLEVDLIDVPQPMFEPTAMMRAFELTPQLSKLSLSFPKISMAVTDLLFPWSQLTALELDHPDSMTVFLLARSCPRLQVFNIDSMSNSPFPVSPVPAHKDMHTLYLSSDGWESGMAHRAIFSILKEV